MKEETLEFIEIAEENLKEAKRALNNKMIRSSCFWSQQAIELYLKAYLIEKESFDIKKHKTHNLIYLTRECYKLDKDFEEILRIKDLENISKFATVTRYGISFLQSLTEEDAERSIKIAEKVRNFVLKKLES